MASGHPRHQQHHQLAADFFQNKKKTSRYIYFFVCFISPAERVFNNIFFLSFILSFFLREFFWLMQRCRDSADSAMPWRVDGVDWLH